MALRNVLRPFLLTLSTLSTAALAQNTGITQLTGAAASSTSTSNGMPTASDDAPGGNDSPSSSSGKVDSAGIVNYYFVFIALILCIAGLGTFFVWRRKRRAMLLRNTTSGDNVQGRNPHIWDPSNPSHPRRRYRWREAETSREEGLNEEGEAPPPYVPKTSAELARANAEGGPAVPLQTLSREEAGLKPPDYEEERVRAVDAVGRRSSASAASGSRGMEQRAEA